MKYYLTICLFKQILSPKSLFKKDSRSPEVMSFNIKLIFVGTLVQISRAKNDVSLNMYINYIFCISARIIRSIFH